MQQTPLDEFFQSDNVLNEVELEVSWLGEESMYCLSCPEFQFDFIYEYASPALKVELCKLSRDDQSEIDRLKQVVRMHDWLVSRHFDFVRNGIRKMLRRGFRRQRMRIVIAELRLLRRQQSKRRFPPMNLERSATALVKASATIEQVDANTLRVVATFLSQREAERQTGIPRTNISRSLRQGRPVGGYFSRSVRMQILMILKAENLVLAYFYLLNNSDTVSNSIWVVIYISAARHARASLSSSFPGSIQCCHELHDSVSVNHTTHEGIDEDLFRDTSQSFRDKLSIHSLVRIVSHQSNSLLTRLSLRIDACNETYRRVQ
jgi:hypothetical protein